MVGAVQTSTSTFGIWAIVVVALVMLAIWLIGISVADNIQTRESRRWWQRLHGPEPALGSPEPAPGSPEPASGGPEPALGGPGSSAVPGQRRGAEDGGERAKPVLDGAGDFRRDAAEADWRTEAPTRPDLPAQAGPGGRHAMPAQRTGDTDRAERSLTGPDPDGTEDDPGQQ